MSGLDALYNEKLRRLLTSYGLENDTAVRFKLEHQILEAKAEVERMSIELDPDNAKKLGKFGQSGQPPDEKQDASKNSVKEIFISYAWGDDHEQTEVSREEIVNQLCEAFAEKGFNILRDKDVLNYRDDIEKFMKRIGSGHFIIAIISKKYLESDYCMYEAKEMLKYPDFDKRVFPIVLPDADIFSDNKFNYGIYWKKRLEFLTGKIDEIGRDSSSMEWLQLERDAKEIKEIVAKFITTVARWNVFSPKWHIDTHFMDLISAIEGKTKTD